MAITITGAAATAPVAPTESKPIAEAVAAAKAPEAAPPKDPRLEAFERKEKQIRRMQMQLQQERKNLEAKANQYNTDYVPKSKLTEDPLSVLTENGITYEKLTELMLNSNSNDPAMKALRADINALKAAQVSAQNAQAEATTAQYQQALKQIGTEVKLLCDSGEEFEMVKNSNAYDAVVELIEQTFNKDGYLMDVKEAANQVETYLLEEAYKMSQFKKVQARLAPKAPAEDTAQKAPQTPGMKTITHQATQAPAARRSTEKERIERAKAAFYGKLNQ